MLISYIAFFLLPSSVQAHPPSTMTLSYNTSNQTLSVTITHAVSDPSTHYVKSVIVYKNDVKIIHENYTSQPSTDTFTYHYTLEATDGDVIEVTAICSISGQISRSITVGESGTDGSDNETPPSTSTDLIAIFWPYHATFMFLSLVVVFSAMIYARYYRKDSTWINKHKYIAVSGVILGLIGVSLSIYMVSSTVGSFQLRLPHSYLGLIVLLMLLITPLLGWLQFKLKKQSKVKVRTIHKWFGRITIALLLLNVLFGLFAAGLIIL